MTRPTFGRTLGETARQLSKVHHRALADFDTDFPTWMLLTLLDEKGVPLTADQVARELDLRIDLAGPAAAALVDRAAGNGLVRPGPAVELTDAGRTFFAEVYAHARATTGAATDGIDPDRLDDALDVLLAVGARATVLLGGAPRRA